MYQRCLPLLLLATTASITNGQATQLTELQVRTPPPSITFPEWKIVGTYDWATEYEVEFTSAFISGIAENDRVPVRIFRPLEAKEPCRIVLITHYWGAGDLRAEVALAQDLASNGIASAILTLPYHLKRTPPGSRSGALAIQPDPDALRATTYQSVLDMRRTIDFLKTRPEFDTTRLGVAGTSLGAIVAALTYALDERVSDVAFILGGIDLAKLLWTSSRVVQARDALRAKGFSEERLRAELSSVEPGTYLPRKEPGNALVVIAKYDTVIPKTSSSALVQAIPVARTVAIETGHYGGIFVQRRLLRETGMFFKAAFDGTAYVPPQRIYAPTIRLGVSAGTTGFDVGAGLDVWSFDPGRKMLATVFVSPRGPSLWLHRQIGSGFSFGLTANQNRLATALLWSSVL